ncbi:hypothetical protein BCR35DRAFT_300899 [Leucosporidium creatinivorum]|uniref:Histidine kinase n=1 Tax=Leucosporidium creatinivorum TaxID=106004 RepID=A0A1Y2FZY4_9BASI|nr:hypothetical protein BCR35DRAFT_300899 [Leucosporidium creatinivorum]
MSLEQGSSVNPLQRQLDRLPPSPSPRLPILSFDESLRLVSLNRPAFELFLPSSASRPVPVDPTAAWFLQGEERGAAGVDDARRQLKALATECAALSWGESLVVELYRCAGDQRTSAYYDVLVEEHSTTSPKPSSDDFSFTILLLRPSVPSSSQYARSPPTFFALGPPPSNSDSTSSLLSTAQLSSSSRQPPPPLHQTVSKWKDRPLPPDIDELHSTLKRVTARVTASPSGELALAEPTPSPQKEPAVDPMAVANTCKEDPDDSLGGKDKKRLNFDEMKRLLDTMPTICFTSLATGQVDWFNNEWYRYTGLGHVESMDFENWKDMFHPDDLVTALPIWVNSMATGEDFRFEYRVKGADGVLRWSVCSGRSKKDEDGKILSWACSITDVEELVQARFQSLQIKEHIQAVLSGADIVLLSVDPDNIVTFFEGSPGAARCLGKLNPEGSIPVVGSRVTWPDSRLQQAVDSILNEDAPFLEMLLDTIDEEGDKTYTRYRFVPLRGGPGEPLDLLTGVIVVASDVTEFHATEEALRESHLEKARLLASETAAKEASRLKTEFLTTISHEIRTPIAGIISICELLASDPTLLDDHRSLVDKAMRSGEVLLELVGMVLDVRKIEVGELTIEEAPFELGQVVADARLFSIVSEQKSVVFNEDIGDYYAGTLLGDRFRLRQVLANALSNAVKFTKQGAITLRIRQEEETDKDVALLFEIEDTGVGIQEDVLPTLFKPFRQADASTARHFGGSGLGLVIAKKLVELMNGSIELTSTYGEGTTMIVRVPFRKAPSTALPRSDTPDLNLDKLTAEARSARRALGVKILLAEDNELLREIISRTLVKMEFAVHAVEDGLSAIDAAHKDRYDVILMDGQMPGTDGYQATASLRQSADPAVRASRIIALTASAIQGDRERCIEAGMDAYLAKPVLAKDLEAAIWHQLGL